MKNLGKENIYLLTVILSFFLMVMMYSMLNYNDIYFTSRPLLTVIAFGGLLFLIVPTIVFVVFKWQFLKRQQGFKFIAGGFIAIVLSIVLVMIFKLAKPDSSTLPVSVFLYYVIMILIIGSLVTGAVLSYLDFTNSIYDKIMMAVWALSLALFFISRLKSFFPVGYLDGSPGQYMFVYELYLPFRWVAIVNEMFDRMLTLLAFLGFAGSVVTKYMSFSKPIKKKSTSVFKRDISE